MPPGLLPGSTNGFAPATPSPRPTPPSLRGPASDEVRPNRWVSRATKRAIDVIGGLVVALLATPVIGVLAVVLAIQLRSWPFFVHHRLGRGGRPMLFPKLRTLPADTPPYADKTEVSLEPGSRLARWLRDRHLDELPQLYLVPLGRLSLVGPRPRMPLEEALSDPAWSQARIQVRQGCTGLWQIGAHTHATVSDSPEYDAFYLRHGSVRLDLWILWRTFVQALGGPGVPPESVPRWTWGRGFAPVPGLPGADPVPPVQVTPDARGAGAGLESG